MARTAFIVRAKSFDAWLKANLDKGQRHDLYTHGADTGWPGLTYNTDCAKLFDKFGEEIWDMAADDAESAGYDNVAALIATFRRKDMTHTLTTFKALMVWYAAERLCTREFEEDNA